MKETKITQTVKETTHRIDRPLEKIEKRTDLDVYMPRHIGEKNN